MSSEIVDGFEGLQRVLDSIIEDFERCHYEEDFSGFVPQLRDAHRGYFEGQHDPSGAAWKPLKPATIARKGHSTILVDSGRLKGSLLNPGHGDGIVEAHRRELLYGSRVPYGIFHQEGTSRMPARPFVGMTDELTDRVTDLIADSTVAQLTH